MYVRGYVCAIIGFGRDRVTIVIKSYEAAAGWRNAVALTTCPPCYIEEYVPENDLHFRALNATLCPESESLSRYPRSSDQNWLEAVENQRASRIDHSRHEDLRKNFILQFCEF